MPTPVDLIGGYYADDTLPWACQDTVNYLPVMAEVAGTLTPKYLKTPPGLKPYQQIGTGPIRGIHDMEGGRFVVSGSRLYRISTTGIGIPIGTIPGVGFVSMTHNQFKTGNQLLVENGQGGGGYVYDSTTGSFAKITDEGYPGSISSDYLDSFLLGVEPQGRFWFHSDLADATSYNTLDRYEAESSPDRIVGLAVSGPEVVVFGQRTIDFFYNAGNVRGTFQSRKQPLDRGCASRHTIAKLDNTLFWLGDDGIVYRLAGYAAKPISTGPMHRAFAGLNWAEASAFVWEDQGFKVYYLTFPDGHTWGYDVVSGLWTRRESFGLDRWRIATSVKWGGKWYGGDFQNGRLWELAWGYVLEGDQEFISRRISPVMADNQNNLGIPFAELIFDTGQGPMTVAVAFPVQPSEPVISGAAPDAAVNTNYPSYQYVVTGGAPPYIFSIESGALPPGISLSSTGLLSSIPTQIGAYNFVVRVVDANGLWDTHNDSIAISAIVMMLGSASGGRSSSSVDGISWSAPSLTSLPSSLFNVIGLSNGRYAAWADTYYYSDTSGVSWTATAGVGGGGGDMWGGKFIIAGAGASNTGKYGISINNGLTFTIKTTTLGFDLRFVAINRSFPNRVIGLDINGLKLAISSDGGETFPTASPNAPDTLYHAVAATGEWFYTFGQRSGNVIMVKTKDGVVFEPRKVLDATNSTQPIYTCVGMLAGTTIIVMATANGAIYFTKNGFDTWTKLPTAHPNIKGIAFNGNRFSLITTAAAYYSNNIDDGFSLTASPLTSMQGIGSPTYG